MNKTTTVRKACVLLAALIVSATSLRAQVAISSANRLPSSAADTSKPGFLWRIHQSAAAQVNTISRLESQLAGELGDNIANPDAVGSAAGSAQPPSPRTAPIEFVVPTVINMDQAGGSNGFAQPDDQMPGIPGTTESTDNIAAEALTWLDLPAGEITMGVNSDDGFEVKIGGTGPADALTSTRVGLFDGGRGVADTIFKFTIAEAGLYAARLTWMEGGGGAAVEWFTVKANGDKALVGDAANGGLKAYRAVTQKPAGPVAKTVVPTPGQVDVAPDVTIRIELEDGSAAVDGASVVLKLDGAQVAATVSKTGATTLISYRPPTLFSRVTQHSIDLAYKAGANSYNPAWSFFVADYGTLTAKLKVTPDTGKPGFIWRVHQVAAAQGNSNARAEAQLAGQLKDADGNPLPNIADPNAVGVALGAAPLPALPSQPLQFEISTTLNLSQSAGEANGNFPSDDQMPGIPGTEAGTDYIAAEILTFIELPAGTVKMGVSSDDGFASYAGNVKDTFQSVFLGQFDGGRGAADTIFTIVVEEAGVYPFRTIWEEGDGGANIEWFSLKADGTKVLINDTVNGGLRAYRAATTPQAAYITQVVPQPAARQLNGTAPELSFTLVDGATDKIVDASIRLKLDGRDVTNAQIARSGAQIKVTVPSTGVQIPSDKHSASLTFTAGTTTRTQDWSFRNLKNILVPEPAIKEDFDSYAEGTQPTGWTALNFTTTCTEGEDIGVQASDTYKNWVVISTDTVSVVDGNRALNIAPGQKFNGVTVAADGVPLMSGNVLYAESDGRCSDQVQFITTKAYDLSKLAHVAITFSSIYEQNQDSIGSVEYSIDDGVTWLPALIFLEPPDIKLNPDGTVNAQRTMLDANADTAAWTDNGVAKGDKYGDALLSPINAAMGEVVVPRINDDSTEGKRYEIVRLPLAGGKSKVKLRFAQLGTDSWYFGIDNLAFYEVPPAPDGGPVEPPTDIKISAIALEGNAVRLTWTGGAGPYLVQAKANVGDPSWVDIATTTGNSVTVPVVGATGFLRIQGGATKTVTLLKATLSGAQEVPAVTTSGTGTGWAAVEGTTVTYYLTYGGLTATATAAHIHGPAEAGATAGVIKGIDGVLGTSGIFAGSTTVTELQANEMKAGRSYFNIHTSTNPGGEIRGQLTP